MSALIANMMFNDLKERRSKIGFTVLYRKDGTWSNYEVSNFVNRLVTEAYQSKLKPEYLILFGSYTKAKTLEALGGGLAYTAEQVMGADNIMLPFKPL